MNHHDKKLTLDSLREPLKCIPSDDRQTWLDVGMAIHAASGGGVEGRSLWDEWSQSSEKFNAREQSTTWNNFKLRDGGKTAGTIFHLAGEHGWKRGGKPHEAPPTAYAKVEAALTARGFTKAATYDYGAAGFKDRWEHATERKRFEWHHPDAATGELVSKRKPGAKVPPYGLQRAQEHADQLIYVAEGEKCADLLNRRGLVAVSIEDGHAETAAKMLPGRTWAVIPDNDKPGKARADRVIAALQKTGKAVLVPLPGLQHDGDDIEQWLAAGNTTARLHELVQDAQQAEIKTLLAGVTYSRNIKLSDRARYLIDEIVPAEGIGILYGASTEGKSFVAEDIAMSVARGRPFADQFEVEGQGLVVYLAIEAPQIIRDRHLGHCQSLGINGADIAFVDRPLKLADPKSVEEFVAVLRAIEADTHLRVRLVIIDTLARAMPGLDEDAAKDAGLAVAGMEAIAKAIGAVVLAVHHTGKNKDNGMRGSSALQAAADFVIEVRDGALNLEKTKIGQKRQGFATFTIKPHVIGQDHKGRDIDAGILEWVKQARAKKRERPTNSRQRQALEVLENLINERRVVPQPVAGVPPGVAEAVEWKVWKDACDAKGLFEGIKNDRTGMIRVRDSLERAGWIGFTKTHVWYIAQPLEGIR